jgi:hypothetical protein
VESRASRALTQHSARSAHRPIYRDEIDRVGGWIKIEVAGMGVHTQQRERLLTPTPFSVTVVTAGRGGVPPDSRPGSDLGGSCRGGPLAGEHERRDDDVAFGDGDPPARPDHAQGVPDQEREGVRCTARHHELVVSLTGSLGPCGRVPGAKRESAAVSVSGGRARRGGCRGRDASHRPRRGRTRQASHGLHRTAVASSTPPLGPRVSSSL